MQLITQESITDLAAERWGTAHNPRLAQIMPELVRYLHDFVRTVELTEAEWAAAVRWLRRTGQISDDKREEFILASDVLGLSMLLVEMNHPPHGGATPATVLGPFHVDGSPDLAFGADMSDGVPGTPLFIVGRICDTDGAVVPGAMLDVWQADANGAYEAQLDVDEARLRGKYTSTSDGAYCVRTIIPVGYSIPMDGPVGELMLGTDISPFRPAHVHFLIDAAGYQPLITHLFSRGAPYLDSDAVFGMKPELVVEFAHREPGPTPDGGTSEVPWRLAHFDFVLQPRD
ncbi:MAG: catechol 1,2-dioxygenase [Mycobacterium sp.]|nr:catechol 1,2-dioxygenase [Mycobacterium sp.]